MVNHDWGFSIKKKMKAKETQQLQPALAGYSILKNARLSLTLRIAVSD